MSATEAIEAWRTILDLVMGMLAASALFLLIQASAFLDGRKHRHRPREQAQAAPEGNVAADIRGAK